jgi:hypothetical protein
MTDEPQEPLRRLEERLSRASEAAERLISEAARTGEPGRPPPAGWQAPGQQEPAEGVRPGSELEPLLRAVHALRELIPPEVLERITAAIREVLLALRSLIDFYVERLERKPEEPVEVQEIPIE